MRGPIASALVLPLLITCTAADLPPTFEYVPTYTQEGLSYLTGKYMARIPPGAGTTPGVSYESCRQMCADGGGWHGTGECFAFLWAPQGCAGWDKTLNKEALCLTYDGQNHGNFPNVNPEKARGDHCNCRRGKDDCYVFEKKETQVLEVDTDSSVLLPLCIVQIIIILIAWLKLHQKIEFYGQEGREFG